MIVNGVDREFEERLRACLAERTPLERRLQRLLAADAARVVRLGGQLFLVIGERRATTDDPGRWYELRAGEAERPVDFAYLRETCCASGRTERELVRSARRYQRLRALSLRWDAIPPARRVELLLEEANA